MLEIQAGDEIVRYDRDATAGVYASILVGWAERCGCVGCRNYLVQRDVIYPSAFSDLLNRLGIDLRKDAEVVADGPLQNGLHHYGGWFFFVGEMVTHGASVHVVSDSPYFGYFLTSVGPCPKEFRDLPRVAVAFEADFEWVLIDSWKSDFRPAATKKPDKRE